LEGQTLTNLNILDAHGKLDVGEISLHFALN